MNNCCLELGRDTKHLTTQLHESTYAHSSGPLAANTSLGDHQGRPQSCATTRHCREFAMMRHKLRNYQYGVWRINGSIQMSNFHNMKHITVEEIWSITVERCF